MAKTLFILLMIATLISCQKKTATPRPSLPDFQTFTMTINGQVWKADTVYAFLTAWQSVFIVTAESKQRKVEIRFQANQPATLILGNNTTHYATVSLGDKFPPVPAKLQHEGDHVEYYITQHPEATGSLQLLQVFQDLVVGRFEFTAIALPSESSIIHIPRIVVSDGSFHTKVLKR